MMRAWTFALIATAVLCAIVPLDGQAYAATQRPLGLGVRYVVQAYDDEDMATAAGLREHWVRITVATQEASPCQQASCNLYIRLEQLQVVVQVQPVDLNDDGAPELLLRSSLCEATGCPYALVMRRSGTWRDMLNPIVAQNIVVNTELSGPLKSLSVTSQRAGYDVIDFTTYIWDGVGYVPETGGSRGQTTPFDPPASAGRFGAPGGASGPVSPFGPPGGSSGSDGPFGSPSKGLPTPRPAYQTRYTITPKAATMGESDGTFVFQLTRVGDLPAETVYVSTVIGAKSGFAVNANDYKGKRNEPVKFGEGVPSQPVTLILYPETQDDGDKTFGLLVERAPGAANNTVLATERFTIRDDDEAAAAPVVLPSTSGPTSVQSLEAAIATGVKYSAQSGLGQFRDSVTAAALHTFLTLIPDSLVQAMSAQQIYGRTRDALAKEADLTGIQLTDLLMGVVVQAARDALDRQIADSGLPGADLWAAAAGSTLEHAAAIATAGSLDQALAKTMVLSTTELAKMYIELGRLNVESDRFGDGLVGQGQNYLLAMEQARLLRAKGQAVRANRIEVAAASMREQTGRAIDGLGDFWKAQADIKFKWKIIDLLLTAKTWELQGRGSQASAGFANAQRYAEGIDAAVTLTPLLPSTKYVKFEQYVERIFSAANSPQ